MTLELAIDLVVVAVLAATTVVASLLYLRLGRLRRSHGEMQALIAALSGATAKAEAVLAGLRELSAQAGRSLGEQNELARTLRDELSFLTERGNDLAERLASGITATRTQLHAAAAAPVLATDSGKPRQPKARGRDAGRDAEPQSEAERELLKALRAVR